MKYFPTILVVNATEKSPVPDADGQAWTNAVQKAVVRDLLPKWGQAAHLLYVPRGIEVPTGLGYWTMVLADHLSAAGALGYHEDAQVNPTGFVGVQTSRDDGAEPSAVLAHEVFEMICDPEASRLEQVGQIITWLECGDPVQSSGPYAPDGVDLENFVLPNYYRLGSAGPWDHLGVLPGPMTIAPQGYRMDLDLGAKDFVQKNGADTRASKLVPHRISRRGRRLARWHAGKAAA